jgi:hypothetical protein
MLPRTYEHGEPSQDDLYRDIVDMLEGPNYVTAVIKYGQSAYPSEVRMNTTAIFDLGTSPRDGSFNDPRQVVHGVEQAELIRDDISDTLPGGLGEPYEGTYLPATTNADRGHESQEQSECQLGTMGEPDGRHRGAQFGRGQPGRELSQERGRGGNSDEKNIHPLFRTGASNLSEGSNAFGSESGLKPEYGHGTNSNEKDIHPLSRTGTNDLSEAMGAMGIGHQRGLQQEHNSGHSNERDIRPLFRGRASDRSESNELGMQQKYGRDRSNDKNVHLLFRRGDSDISEGSGAPGHQGRHGAGLRREHGRGYMNQDGVHPLLRGRPNDPPERNDDLGQEGRAPLRSMNAYPGRVLFPKPSENSLRRRDPPYH